MQAAHPLLRTFTVKVTALKRKKKSACKLLERVQELKTNHAEAHPVLKQQQILDVSKPDSVTQVQLKKSLTTVSDHTIRTDETRSKYCCSEANIDNRRLGRTQKE